MLDFKFNFYFKFKDVISVISELCFIISDNIFIFFICKCGIDNLWFSDINKIDRQFLSVISMEKFWRCYQVVVVKIEIIMLKQVKYFNFYCVLFKDINEILMMFICIGEGGGWIFESDSII